MRTYLIGQLNIESNFFFLPLYPGNNECIYKDQFTAVVNWYFNKFFTDGQDQSNVSAFWRVSSFATRYLIKYRRGMNRILVDKEIIRVLNKLTVFQFQWFRCLYTLYTLSPFRENPHTKLTSSFSETVCMYLLDVNMLFNKSLNDCSW